MSVHEDYLDKHPLVVHIPELNRSVPTLAILTAQGLDSCQRAETRRLADGRHDGDSIEIAGLRTIGVQDDGLGLTSLGRDVADLLDCSWQTRERFGLTRYTS